MSLTRLAEESLDKYGEYVALAFEGRQYTNVEQHRTAGRVANALYIVERKKDLIIRGGFNIYPREVEEVLYAFPKTAEAAVIAMPDALMGEDVLAVVVLKAGEAATADDVMAFCATRLARFKCPKHVRFVDALPKSPIGKILKKELRRQL